MYDQDVLHPNASLETKLRAVYALRRGGRLALGFRESYRALLKGLGDPHKHLPPTIHVAGTNGKGSTIAFMRGVFEASGYKTHIYTSPHLVRFNERIRLAGRVIADHDLEALLDEVMRVNAGASATFFEVATALAFTAFSRVPADIVLLETGLGGRLDCTNIIDRPQASVITMVSSDHAEILGPSLSAIAAEKAGIIKTGRPCVIGPQTESAKAQGVPEVFVRKAQALDSPLFRHGSEWFIDGSQRRMRFTFGEDVLDLPLPGLAGPHQIGNAGTALAALKLVHSAFPITPQAIHTGLTRPDWPARLQKIEPSFWGEMAWPQGWSLWLDGGHNDSAGDALAAQARLWRQEDGLNLHIIIGMMGSKHPQEFLSPLLREAASLTAIPIPDEPASHPPEAILEAAGSFAPKTMAPNLESALAALTERFPPGRVLIAGSLYLAGHILSKIETL